MPHPCSDPSALMPSSQPVPRLVFWETTGACNLRCVHCRRQWDGAPFNQLTTDEARRLIIGAIAEAGWGSILVFSGGEPLMRSDLFELLDHARSLGVTTAVATNATRIDTSVAKRLACSGVRRASVSLDGAGAETHDSFRSIPGAFDQALRGISALRAAGIEVQINVTFTRRNMQEATQMLELVESVGACALHIFLLVPVGCGVDLPDDVRLGPAEVERLLSFFDDEAAARGLEVRATCAPQAQRIRIQRARDRHLSGTTGLAASAKGCLAGGTIIFVDAVGKVFPCGYLPIEVGDIRCQPLVRIVQDSSLLRSLRDVSLLRGRCGDCAYSSVCGGCRARAYAVGNELFGEEPSCPMGSRSSGAQTSG